MRGDNMELATLVRDARVEMMSITHSKGIMLCLLSELLEYLYLFAVAISSSLCARDVFLMIVICSDTL